jgi:hypothetical protein
MSMDAYTEDLADFGYRERMMAAELLAAPLPDGFDDDGIRLAMNRDSGNVFLVNSDYQVAMMHDGELELFFTSPYEGLEGFADELADQYDDMAGEDRRWAREMGLVDAEGVDA